MEDSSTRDQVVEFLQGEIYYDGVMNNIWVKKGERHSELILDVRGYGALSSRFPNITANIQDSMAEFIVEAIQEKLDGIQEK